MLINRLINWFPLLLQRNNMPCCTMLALYTSYKKIPYCQAKKIIDNCSTCWPLHLRPITQDINPQRLQPNKLWQVDVIHCPKLSPSSFLQVCIDTFLFYLGNTSLQWSYKTYYNCFAIMKTPSSIKTDNGPAYTSSCFKQFLHFLLNILQVFLIIHRHKTYQTDTSHIKTTNKKIKKGGIHRNTTVFLI